MLRALNKEGGPGPQAVSTKGTEKQAMTSPAPASPAFAPAAAVYGVEQCLS